MSVVYNKQNQLFKVSDVLWSKPELVNAIVEQMLLNQTEAFIDMMIDMQDSDPVTRETVNNTLQGVKDSAGDFFSDMIGDLERSVRARLAEVNYGAAVTGLKFDLAGDITDIEVDISVN